MKLTPSGVLSISSEKPFPLTDIEITISSNGNEMAKSIMKLEVKDP